MSSSERSRRDLLARRRRRAAASSVESLEGRQLMAYSPIGSLPDLTVTGEVGPIAAYGGPLTVSLNVFNLGASSTVEPLALAQGAASTADSLPSHVGVYLMRGPHIRPGAAGSVKIGEVAIPSVRQNSAVEVTDTLTLPSRPNRRFPVSGGTAYVGFKVDDLRETRELDRTNNFGNVAPITINAALPDLAAIAIDLPTQMQPGDTIAPDIKIANYGTVNTATQGPVTVLLVASTDTNYGPTDVIVGRYEITDLPGLSQAPSSRTVLGDVNLDDPANVLSLTLTSTGQQTVTLPPGTGYFLGVIVDPLNEIRELHEIGTSSSSALRLVRRVGDVAGLPPAGTLSDPSPTANQFPIPAFAPLGTLTDFLGDATQASTIIYSTGGASFNQVARNAKKTGAGGSTAGGTAGKV